MTDKEIKQIKRNWVKRQLVFLMHVNVSILDDDEDKDFGFRNSNHGTYIDDMSSDGIYDWISAERMSYHKLFTNNDFIIFDKSKLSDTPTVYPQCVLYEHTFELLDEETTINSFSIVMNDEQLQAVLNRYNKDNLSNIKYCSIVFDEYMEFMASYDTVEIEMRQRYKRSTMKTIDFNNEDVLIIDPCYFVKREDRDKIMFGHNYKKLGIRNTITRYNNYGDCQSGIINSNKELIGVYDADDGMVCICRLAEVLNYNHTVQTYIDNKSACVIKNFTGSIHFEIDKDNEFYIVGKGSIDFKSQQISL